MIRRSTSLVPAAGRMLRPGPPCHRPVRIRPAGSPTADSLTREPLEPDLFTRASFGSRCGTLFDYRDYRARWDQRAAELAVAPVVLGPVDEDALPPLAAAAGAFAFPSAKEGVGLAAREAPSAPASRWSPPTCLETVGRPRLYGQDAPLR